MRLVIVSPLQIVVDEPNIASLRAEDASGSFGILPGHTDFLTSLTVSVVRWRNRDGKRHFCAVRSGVLTVSDGTTVSIATREAVPGDDLDTLDTIVIERFRSELAVERTQNVEAIRLHLDMIRRLVARAKGRPHAGPEGMG
ncbi:F0F1 ATP synthase subunit epsilon [Breoghania sp.]|uniref:F0F1 ATP synthase subunit epsilon n=1 Tax=Breoghania sp. TaxID=2065378 RepID=UPI0026142ECA|nr:F0F1 ATP synthase subunit epsilon [Breoghania sp.]MDJ0929743.1 F0F1 ATP synthase subunit epsilon [Breoghania sp.]